MAVRASNKTIDLLSALSLEKVGVIEADLAKCMLMTAKFVFVGTWSGKLLVYDVARDYKLLNYLKCKQSVRSICQLRDNILILG